ncbi:MAG: ATP-binding protein [Anaerolineae bacterium]
MMEPIGKYLKKIQIDISQANMPTTSSTDGLSPSTGAVLSLSKGSGHGGDSRNSGFGDNACPICRGLGFITRDVPVGHPDFGRAIPCQCKREELEATRLSDLRRASNLGMLSHMTFDSFRIDIDGLSAEKQKNLRQAFAQAQSFAEQPDGWLIFKGGYGCGKTHLAAAIANRRIECSHPALFIVVPDLLDHLRATFSPTSEATYDERFESVRTTPLLILDDLGTHAASSWAQEKLYQIFNHRYNAQLPTVITTNHELEEIDLRLRSRMVDPSLVTICTILAPDYRRGMSDDLELSSLSLHQDQTFGSFDLRPGELDREKRENLKRAYSLVRNYAENPVGWLVLTGTYGCGKTHLAAAIANYRADRGYPPLFVTVADLLDHLRATFSPNSLVSYDKLFEQVRTADFLVLDDLMTQSATPWAREKLYQLFDYRYNARLPTVITMNETLDEVDPRLRSRMLDRSRCTIFAMSVPSYRKKRN